MGVDMELEFEKYCRVGGSPNTVLSPLRPRSKVEKRRSIKGKPRHTDDLSSLGEDFVEINFRGFRRSSCEKIPSRSQRLEGSEVLKRGSIYQTSREVRKIKKIGSRRKIELPRATTSSLGVVDSLCGSDNEDNSLIERKRSSAMSLNSDLSTTTNVSCDGFLEIPLSSNSREDHSAENVASEKMEDPKSRCDPNVGPSNDGDDLHERDTSLILRKSSSAKLALPHSPSQSESDSPTPNSPTTRFSPLRKMFDPFTNSKSQRSDQRSASQSGRLRRNTTLRKSLLNDFSTTLQSREFGSQFAKKDLCSSAVSCSPAHLHGCLKLETKHGVPFLEFSLKSPPDVFVARTWKADNGLNCVYTFHNKKKSNTSGWGLKDSNKVSSMVGQMQVSNYLCTERKDDGDFNNSVVTEFVLYDIVHARKRVVAAQGNPKGSPDDVKHATENGHFGKSTPHPWAPADLHPSLEIAAIVIQVPFETRESLKFKVGDAKSDQPQPKLLDLSAVEQRKDPTKVNVVIPSGNHSLPTTESHGPSPLLDRWRLGGGCDCGGWDMACPLTVFGNSNNQSADGDQRIENQQPLELFVQGAKENSPALTMTLIGEGRYSVDFHAQLSTFQAFSICIAILHCTEASIAVGHERDKESLKCNSLRVFVGEEVQSLIEAVTEEEKRIFGKRIEEIPPSFQLNPPFSPIARV